MKKVILFVLVLFISLKSFSQHTVMVKKNGMTYSIQGDTTKLSFKSTIAEFEERYNDAANYLVMAIEKGEFKKEELKGAYYNSACYYSLVGNSKKAVKYLLESIKNGYDDLGHLDYDKDLSGLKDSHEWKFNIDPVLTKYYLENNKRLAQLFNDDQSPRLSGQMNKQIAVEDSIRRIEVADMLDKGLVKSGHDYYRAAMIMQHGTNSDDYEKAHELTKKALTNKQVHPMAPWLYAATKDRLLLSQGKPQWYGTQGVIWKKGKMTLNPKEIDTNAVAPKERIKYGAPSIETIREYLKSFNSN